MKVLHLIDSGGFYGAEAVLFNLMNHQENNGYKTTLGSIRRVNDGQKEIEKKVIEAGFQVELFRMRYSSTLHDAIEIIKYANNNNIDIIHCHGYKPNILLGLLPLKYKNIPHITTLHGWTSTKILSKIRIYEWADAFMMKYASCVVVVSTAMLNNKRLKLFKINPVVIQNGIPMISKFDVYKESFAFDCMDKNDIKIISIGRLSKEKGFDVLIRSIHNIMTEYDHNIKLCIVGEGPEKDSLVKLTNDFNLTDNIYFAGYIPDAYRVLEFFDLFVMSSLTEGMPITLLEAMRIGMPIVATGVGGIPEALDYGKCGIIVSPGNEIELAEGIMRSQEDKTLKINMHNNSLQQFHDKFTVERMEEKYRLVYKYSIDQFNSWKN